MIADLAMVLVVGQGPKTLIDQIGIAVDPQNGYFDYVRAADLTRSEEAGYHVQAVMNPEWALTVIQRSESPPRQTGGGSEQEAKGALAVPLMPEAVAAARRFMKMTPLEIKREAKQKFKDVLLHLERGRNKKIWEPRTQLDFKSTFPELSAFRNLARFLMLIMVDVDFADGFEKEAITAYLDCFRVGEASESSGTLIGVLVSRANQAIVLRSIEKHMSRLSLPDCKRIDDFVTRHLNGPDQFAKAFAGEREMVMRTFDQMFDPGGMMGEIYGDEYVKKVEAVPANLRPALIAETKRLYEERIKEPTSVLSKGEREWAIYLDTRPKDRESSVTEGSPLSHILVEMTVPAMEQVINAALLRRIQMRLLRTGMAVMKYRWTHGRLPEKLDGIAPEDVIRDPVTGGKFQYRVREEFFELIGTGAREHGEIRLVYKIAPKGDGSPPPPSE